MHSDYQSVKEQSGIFAGDGGYTIDIAGHSHLEGGLVTSTRQAESQGLNRFRTGTLSYGDIANHANYRGSAMSMDGQITLAGQGGPKKVGNQQLLDVAKYAGESQRALGIGQTRDSQQSTTRSGINTANLEITDIARQQMQLNYQTAPAIQMNSGIAVGNPHPVKRDNPVSLQAHLAGIKTDTDTQTVAQQAQALTNRFDKDKVQRELDFQVNTTKQFGQTLAEAKRQTKAHLLTNASEQTKQYVDWAFDTLGAGLTTGSVQAAGVAAVSPFANRTIKQLTTDRQTGETNLVTNTLAHAALGALEAKATGNNAAAGAMAGAGGELAAHLAAKAYGVDGKTKTTQDLTEQEKATVKTLGQLGGMAAGGLIGDNSQSTVSSMQIAERAVEHNYLYEKEQQSFEKEMIECKSKRGDCSSIVQKYLNISNENSKNLRESCSDGGILCAGREELIDVATNMARVKYDTSGRIYLGKPLQDDDTIKIVNYLNERDLGYLRDKVSTTDRLMYQAMDITNWPFLIVGSRNLIMNNSPKALLATGVGAGMNAVIQYSLDGDIKTSDLIAAGILGKMTAGKTYNTTVNLNTGGAYYFGKVNGEDNPALSALTSRVASIAGYKVGNKVEDKLDPHFNPPREKYRWIAGYLGISSQPKPSVKPSIFSNIADSYVSEKVNKSLSKDNSKNDNIENIKGNK